MPSPQSSSIHSSTIDWQGDTPCSVQFDDIYFSRENGLQETRYVFLQQNALPQRWQEAEAATSFTIVETGFGTGLNFLATWQAWRACPAPKPRLCFVSVEKYPLRLEDLKSSLAYWPELTELSEQLCEHYPPAIAGNHQLQFDQGRVQLNLILGDITALSEYPFTADCWFLDGFAPSKNPQMWQPSLFDLMRERSRPGTSFATFTSAGVIKRALKSAGFSVLKVKGFGHKREMLRGHLSAEHKAAYFPRTLAAWSKSPSPTYRDFGETSTAPVVIVGAGLSGMLTAHALATRGIRSIVLDRAASPMSEASGQRQLALFAKLPILNNRESRLLSQCLIYSQRYFALLQQYYSHYRFWHPTGLLQLAWNDAELKRLKAHQASERYPRDFMRVVTAQEATSLAGIPINTDALWFPHSGWLSPDNLGSALLSNPLIEFRGCTTLNQITHRKDAQWRLVTSDGNYDTSTVVIACAHQSSSIEGLPALPLKSLRGQVSSVYSDSLVASQCVICGEGYLCPAIEGTHHFGATYDLNAKHTEVTAEDHQRNLLAVKKWLPGWLGKSEISLENLTGRAGLRCTTADYFPLVGPYPDTERMRERFHALRYNANDRSQTEGAYFPGIYYIGGHGSKGLTTIPSCSEWLASLIRREPSMLSAEQIAGLNPARFLIRRLIRNLD